MRLGIPNTLVCSMVDIDAPETLASWYEQRRGSWSSQIISKLVLPEEGSDLNNAAVKVEASPYLASIALWGNGMVEVIVFDGDRRTELFADDIEANTAEDIFASLDISIARVEALLREGSGRAPGLAPGGYAFDQLDMLLEEWAELNQVAWQSEYRGEEVRSAEVVGPSGKRCQLWVDPPDAHGRTAVSVWDFDNQSARWQAHPSTLSDVLDHALKVARSWVGSETSQV